MYNVETYNITNSEAFRPIMMNRGVIPSVAQMDSGIRMPDNNIEQFLNEKAREQWAITKQVLKKKIQYSIVNNFQLIY